MKVLKFGGKSLASEQTFTNVIQIIKNKSKDSQLVVVVSAIGDTTDTLEELADLAKNNQEYQAAFKSFKARSYHQGVDLEAELQLLSKLFEGVSLIEDCTPKIKDLILAQGELISSRVLAKHLNAAQLKATEIDSRDFIVTDDCFGNAVVDEVLSKSKTQDYFN